MGVYELIGMMEEFVNRRTSRDLGWGRLLDALAARCLTARGREHALSLRFLSSTADIATSFARIAEARHLRDAGEALPLGGIDDIRDLLGRAAKQAILTPLELLACAKTLRLMIHTRRFLMARSSTYPLLATLAHDLPAHLPWVESTEATIEASGSLCDGAGPVLKDARQRASRLHSQMKERLKALLDAPQFVATMQDNYFSIRGDRYVVPIHAAHRNKVPGLIHNASQSGQTVFVEPAEIIPLGNDLAIAASLVSEEERRILANLSHSLGQLSDIALQAIEIVASLDLIAASADLACKLDATDPELTDAAGVRLENLRHPLLILQEKPVVGNDVMLTGEQSIMVISGPNAGGKTVTLTALGLCILMVRAGLPIPVEPRSALPWFGQVRCAIGDAQDLQRGLSSFSAHLQALHEIFTVVRRNDLVLLDEIAGDTDPREGSALARAILEALAARQTTVFVTTHLEELKALGIIDKRFVNARVGLEASTQRPTYRLEMGALGVSNALAVAEHAGLDGAVLQQARHYLANSGFLSAALHRLQQKEAEAEKALVAVEAMRRTLATQREQLRQAAEAAEAARQSARADIYQELSADIDKVRRDLVRHVATLQSQPTLRDAQAIRHSLAEQLRRVEVMRHTGADTAEASAVLEPGVWVFVQTLGQAAEVVQCDGDSALVALGNLRARLKVDDLKVIPRPPSAAKKSFSNERKAPADVAPAAAFSLSTRCDLRGLRADEALRQLERFLDVAFGDGATSLLVVHGHGTGALKERVRDYLHQSPYVATARPGERHEGGDGVTFVLLAN